MYTLQGVLSPSLSGSSTSVQSSSSVHSMSKSSQTGKSLEDLPRALNLWPAYQSWSLARRKRSTKKLFQHAIWRNSSLGCSHSDAEKVISTLAPLTYAKESSSEKLASRMVELKESTLRARSSINSAKSSQSTASEKTSNCESALDQEHEQLNSRMGTQCENQNR